MESQAESSLAQPSDNEVETATSLSSCFGRICLVRLSCNVVPRRNTSVRFDQFFPVASIAIKRIHSATMEAPTSHPSSRLLLPRRVQKLQLAPGERLTVFSHGSVWIADVSCGTPPTRCASPATPDALQASPNAALLRDARSSCSRSSWPWKTTIFEG